jgi:membrane-bound ClpP family serine protease
LGPVWCLVRWLTAVPLLVGLALLALVPNSELGLLFWWEWVSLRPLVSRRTPKYSRPERSWDKVPLNATGRTITALRPTGKILINDVEYEARSEGGWVGIKCLVLVIGSDAHGLIVREQALKTT